MAELPKDADKRAREWVQKNARPCPCCGSALLLMIDGDEAISTFRAELAARGARTTLVPAEEAEREIAARDFRPVNPIGGPS